MSTNQKYKIVLEIRLQWCPQYWQNFIEHTRALKDTNEYVDSELLKFNCRWYYDNERISGVEFDSAEDATAFKLRWS